MEILILATNRHDYEAGDILDIRPDGFDWGVEEQENPLFDIVIVDDADLGGDLSTARATYLDQLRNPAADNDVPGQKSYHRIRKWKVSGSDLIEKTGDGNSSEVRRNVNRRPWTHPPGRGPRRQN